MAGDLLYRFEPTADRPGRPMGEEPPHRGPFPDRTGPAYLLSDRDSICGPDFAGFLHSFGAEDVVTAPRSPWQNPYAERLIGSIRRECLDHMIIVNKTHLRRTLTRYLSYYHGSLTHLSLAKDALTPRRVQSPEDDRIIAYPEVGGLYHRYERRAA